MQTWIFQGNPDEFDIDGYLASRPATVIWLVTRYAEDIAPGDRVYLWRNKGKAAAVAGIVAEAIVISPPVLRPEDPDSVPFWRTASPRSSLPQVRAALRLVKVASKREVLRRDWFDEDPVLKGLPNLKMQAATNYKIDFFQAFRLSALWGRTGQDWSRNESLAGLWAYSETAGKPISKLPGTPVSKVALTIGRAVSGVYAKVMNFRAIDPGAASNGMSGAGEADRAVWREFYDPEAASLRVEELRKEFTRIWSVGEPAVEVSLGMLAVDKDLKGEASYLEAQGLSALLEKFNAQRALAPTKPTTNLLSRVIYERNPLVVAIAGVRAGHRCEFPGCEHPTFETATGRNYTEIHHILSLSEGGEDTIENVACLCPAHHREAHLGRRAPEIFKELIALRTGG